VKDNLIAFLLNQPLTPHKPQAEFLGLISTGDKYAVASRGEHALEGEFLWRLKDEIDRGWMDMYQTLPSMEEMMDEEDVIAPASKSKNFIPPILASRGKDALAAFIEAPMRCGGCGAKVGAGTLTRVLDTVHRRRLAHSSPDASHEKKPNKIDPDDAAIVMLPKTGGGAMIQTIDFFRSFISDPFVFGKIAAVHALSDCHAMGAKAQTALALAVVKFSANEAMTERTLVDMLSGACDVLDAENCELAGGHTCEGAEQALGFAVSGFIQDPSKLLRKRGGKVGDKIILTKAIGTGALFAADMRAKCRGELVEEAIESMITSNGPASHIAMDIVEARSDENDRGIHSCTDVTGFGLCGHLLEMLVANDDLDEELDSVSASLDLNAIPFFKGAIEAVASGISSSLYRENSRSRRAVSNHEEAAKSCPAKYPLLFDPQTAGGLLFFVSPGVYEDFVQKLLDDPMTKLAAVIGELTEYTPAVSEFDVCEIDGSCTPTANRIYVNF
jgi:selenide,water dikinase